jgi:hypothetical protein
VFHDLRRRLNGTGPVPLPPQAAVPRETRIRRSTFIPSHHPARAAAVKMTRLSCHRFRSNQVRLGLSLLAYNLGNLWRRLALPKRIENWSLMSLRMLGRIAGLSLPAGQLRSWQPGNRSRAKGDGGVSDKTGW